MGNRKNIERREEKREKTKNERGGKEGMNVYREIVGGRHEKKSRHGEICNGGK